MIILQNAYAFTHLEVKMRTHRKTRCFDPDQYAALAKLVSLEPHCVQVGQRMGGL